MKQFDVAIIGGGIVGLATAYQLIGARPELKLVVLEKESELATHQTGHNSGVLHSGIYYKPGSLKAINCRQGKLAMQQFCQQHEIEFDICGKVIVAVEPTQQPILHKIFERGRQNGVSCELIDQTQLRELEPHVAGIEAIHVPEAGIVDYKIVCQRLAESIQNRDATVLTSARVTALGETDKNCTINSKAGDITANFVVNCAGLHCDRVAKLAGTKPAAKILPFRGEYYQLQPEKRHLCRNLIYPVPDPKFPFLGVHFTRMIDDSVECGPNAVLAFAQEGYSMSSINLRDLTESLTYSGFWRLAARHWKMGAGEFWRSFSKRAFVRALRKLVPEIQSNDLLPAPAGVRAQAVMPSGALVDDFLFNESKRIVSVNNAPSPAATASLNIGKLIADKLQERF